MAKPDAPTVVAILPVRDADVEHLPALLADVRAQAGVDVEPVVVDQTLAGDLAERWGGVADVRRELSPSRGLAWRHGRGEEDEARAAWCAWCVPGTRLAPDRFRASIEAAGAGADLVTCDLTVVDEAGYARPVPGDLATVPAALFEATVLVRPSALAELDTTCFWPVERELWKRLGEAGRIAHLPRALVEVDAARHAAAVERAREDRELLEVRSRVHDGAPLVTVLLATHERCDVVLECLEGFARQQLPRGAHEIVVIDDGSTDGTVDVCGALELSVPFTFLHKEADGASRARIFGMPHATGDLLLFVNDDTIPFPDTVAAHLAAHRDLAAKKPMVLGSFEQPDEHLGNAFTRLLERTHYVFGYPTWTPGQELEAAAFYTCNISVPRAAVEEAGGFDPDFSHYGCEDTDLGARLEDLGWTIHYRPECRAIHRHLLTFDVLRRRQGVVARAHVRLFAKHPRLLSGNPWADLVPARIRRRIEPVRPFLPAIEAAGRTLARVDVRRLAGAGNAFGATAERIESELESVFTRLNVVWWDEGFLDGMELHGLRGMSDALASWDVPPGDVEGRAVLLRAADERWPTLAEAWLARHGTRAGRTEDDAVLVVVVAAAQSVEEVERTLAPIVLRARRNGRSAPVAIRRVAGDDEPAERAPRLGDVPLPMPLATRAATRVAAWPFWSERATNEALAAAIAPLCRRADACLALLHGPDDPVRAGLAELEAALRRSGVEVRLELALVPVPTGDDGWERLVGSVDALVVPVGIDDERATMLELAQRVVLKTADDVARWLAERDRLATVSIPRLEEAASHA